MTHYYEDIYIYIYSTKTCDTHIFYDCGTNNVLIPEVKSLGCMHHVVMKRFKHTSMSGRGKHDNTSNNQVTLIVVHNIVPLPVCLSQCLYLHINVSTHTCTNIW